MRCKTCDYQLWNLTARTCPECGDPFAPSGFEFRPNAVEFRCPHCAQSYYGTTAEGHLSPRAFTCVSCSQPIDMDEMVVLPAHGVDPDRAGRSDEHWVRRAQLGRVRAWWQTSVLGLFNPIELGRRTPPSADLWPAWKYTGLNLLIVGSLGVLTWLALMTLSLATAAQGGGTGAGMMMLGFTIMYAVGVIVVLVCIMLWILLAHAILRLTGGAPRPMRATTLSILYSSGACLPNLIPCVNYFSWLWWPISAGLALMQLQGVSAWRSMTATLAPPLLAVASFIGLYVWLIFWALSVSNTAILSVQNYQMGSAAWIAVNTHEQNTGSPARHPLELISSGALAPSDVTHPSTRTTLGNVPASALFLYEFAGASAEDQKEIAQAEADALPEGITAQRLGDLVFTHYGFSLSTNFSLWSVIISPDPDANPGVRSIDGSIWVVLSSGSIDEILETDFNAELEAQNALRATYDLPPLPHPSEVTHARPADAP